MTRPSRSVPPRPRTTTPTNLAFRPSTSGWYASWKAQKTVAPPVIEPEPENKPEAGANEALVRWLSGGSEQ